MKNTEQLKQLFKFSIATFDLGVAMRSFAAKVPDKHNEKQERFEKMVSDMRDLHVQASEELEKEQPDFDLLGDLVKQMEVLAQNELVAVQNEKQRTLNEIISKFQSS